MKTKLIPSLAIGAYCFMMTGCAISPVTGAINFTKHSGIGSIGVVDNSVSGTKVGESSCQSILGLVAFGDCSVEAAKKSGGITKVNSVDHATTSVLWFYSEYKTVVRGE